MEEVTMQWKLGISLLSIDQKWLIVCVIQK